MFFGGCCNRVIVVDVAVEAVAVVDFRFQEHGMVFIWKCVFSSAPTSGECVKEKRGVATLSPHDAL